MRPGLELRSECWELISRRWQLTDWSWELGSRSLVLGVVWELGVYLGLEDWCLNLI